MKSINVFNVKVGLTFFLFVGLVPGDIFSKNQYS